MSVEKINRREFLKLVRTGLLTLSGLLGLAGLVRFLGYQSEPQGPTEFVLEAPEAYALGSRTLLPQVPALLIRSATGFQALSLVCPHLGCTVNPQLEGFTCPCHGSRFRPAGWADTWPGNQGPDRPKGGNRGGWEAAYIYEVRG
jgi:cytochrome b6-f complex iron-sulfur subunit